MQATLSQLNLLPLEILVYSSCEDTLTDARYVLTVNPSSEAFKRRAAEAK